MIRPLLAIVCLLSTCVAGLAQPGLQPLDLKIDGAKRHALIHAPAGKMPAPLVFVFHGHGGTSAGAAKMFDIQKHWAEAIVVYPQGVPTPSKTDPKGEKSGWQHAVGDHSDRDLKYFDALLAHVRNHHPVDDRRIYSTGHSNGGGFTYLLWAARGDVLAAVAPSSAAGAL